MAAPDVIAGKEKVIDLAYGHGYDTQKVLLHSLVFMVLLLKIKGDTSKIKVFYL